MKFFISLRKECNWLRKMAQDGWLIKDMKFGILYTFEKAEPVNMVYEADRFNLPNHPSEKDIRQKEEFCAIAEELGWYEVMHDEDMNYYFAKEYDENELIAILNEFQARYPHLQLILEPGSAFTWDTGCLVATVEDKVCNGGVNTLMLNVSFACHMPDCLEMPYKPVILGAHDPQPGEKLWRMGGNCCLAGDYYGDWAFDGGVEPEIGTKIVFRDMIHYTMVKTTLFNGVTHPSIGIWNPTTGFRLLRKFGYADYKSRMA